MMIENLYVFNSISWLWILWSLRSSNQRYPEPKDKRKGHTDICKIFVLNKGVELFMYPIFFIYISESMLTY